MKIGADAPNGVKTQFFFRSVCKTAFK